jgi:3-oxoacyl-[acyl-carrier protein] reductase
VKSRAVEVGQSGASVNAVAPGVIESPRSLEPTNRLEIDGVAAAGRTNPAGRVGRPEDASALYCFLASEEAGIINGQLITVGGGWTFFH